MTPLRHQKNNNNFQNLRPQVPPNYPIQQKLQNGYVNSIDSKDQISIFFL